MNKLLKQKLKGFLYVSFYVFCWAICSCQERTVSSVEEYTAFLNNPDNGLTKSAVSDGLQLTVRYLPSNYNALVEVQKTNAAPTHLDSLSAAFSHTATFHLLIESADPQVPLPLLLHQKATSPFDLQRNLQTLNYEMENFIYLKNGERELVPVLTVMESTLESDKKVSLLVAFSSDLALSSQTGEGLKFYIRESFFLNSPLTFNFEADHLSKIPTVLLSE